MTLTRRDLDEVASEVGAICTPDAVAAYRPRYNVAPTDVHVILRGGDGQPALAPGVWGLRPDGRDGRLVINARAETAGFKPTFRAAFSERRCVVPADGFFEWQVTPDGRHPLWFHRPDGKLLLLAGLYQDEPDGRGGIVQRFVVLTTAPNALVRPIHDRMPAVLAPEEVQTWLDAPTDRLLRPAPEAWLVATPVSRRVNSVRNDDPACLTPVAAPPPGGRQMSLF